MKMGVLPRAYVLLLLLTLMFSIFPLTNQAFATEEYTPLGYTRYTDRVFGWSIAYPEDWVERETGPFLGFTVGPKEDLSVVVGVEAKPKNVAESYFRLYSPESARSAGYEVEVLEEEHEVKIGDLSAIKVVFRSWIPEVEEKEEGNTYTEVFFPEVALPGPFPPGVSPPEQGIILHCWSSTSSYDKYSQVFEQIITSFQLVSETAPPVPQTPTPTPTPTPAPIISTPAPTPRITPTPTPTPGFEAILAIAGLLAVVYLFKKGGGKYE